MDVFLNIAGGIRMQEPAGDLAVATALASSVFDRALPPDAMFIGEVGLGGEIRPVAQVERRLAEGAKLGITRATGSLAYRDGIQVRRVPVTSVPVESDDLDHTQLLLTGPLVTGTLRTWILLPIG